MDAEDSTVLKTQLDRLGAAIDARASSRVIQMPFWPDPARGVPNEFIRSSLFAAIQAQGREFLDNAEIASQDGVSITFTGQRLDQSHLDVFEGVMHIARGMHEGNQIRFSAHRLLKLIGRNTGKSDHVWLQRTLQLLTATSIQIRDTKAQKLFWGSLLPRGAADEEGTAQYVVEINRDLARLFDRGFTQIDWDQRKRLRRKPLAQWLHLYYSSHARPFPVTVTWLRDKSGSKTASIRAFRQNLRAALDEIRTVGVIDDWSVENDLVRVARRPTPSQQRYIERVGQANEAGQG
jgi:hypothetical protein